MFAVRHARFPASVLVLAGVVSTSWGQALPGVPGVPAAPAAPAVPGAPGAELGPGFFGKMCLRLDACKRKIADTPLGQLLQNAKKPLSALTGGIVGGPLKPTDKEAAAPGVGGAAAAGKKDAAEAAKRRADVKYLGTLDCRYYPDAAKALADGLRTDPSECVRYEAALALGHACCCSEVTVKALTASVSGMDTDGNPAERSTRVRMAACIALERCLACYTPPTPEPEPEKKNDKPKGEKSTTGEKSSSDSTGPESEKKEPNTTEPEKKETDKKGTDAAAKPMVPQPSKDQVELARQTVSAFHDLMAVSQPVIQAQVQSTPKSLYHLIQAAASEPVRASTPAYTTPPTVQMAMASRPTPAATIALKPAVPDLTPAARMEPATSEPRKFAPPPQLMPTAPSPDTTTPVKAEMKAEAKAEITVSPTAEARVKELSTKSLTGPEAASQHAAIRELVKYDWKTYPLVASTMLLGAQTTSFKDAVRVDFIRHLVAYRVNHREVIEGLASVTLDTDPWVREEATKALEALMAIR
jgi:hypothetical protein